MSEKMRLDHQTIWGERVEIQHFKNNFMMHIKLKGIMNVATWSQIFFQQSPSPTHKLIIGVNFFFSDKCDVGYQIKGNHEMQYYGSKYIALRPPLSTFGMGSKGQNSTFSEHCHVAYQNKGNHECTA